MPQAWAKNNKGNTASGSKLTIAKRTVKDAYFAHAKVSVSASGGGKSTATGEKTYTVIPSTGWYRVETDTGKSKEEIMRLNNMTSDHLDPKQVLIVEKASSASASAATHTVGANDTLYGISTKHGVTVPDLKKWNQLSSNTISPGQKLLLAEGKQRITFEKTNKALLGYELYIVVETENLADQVIDVSLRQGKQEVIVAEHEGLTLQFDGKDLNTIQTKVGEFAALTEYENSAELQDLAIYKVILGPSSESGQDAWQRKLKDKSRLFTHAYLTVDAHTENGLTENVINYQGYAGSGDDTDRANHFLNEKNNWLFLYAPCDCGAKLKLKYTCHRYRKNNKTSYRYGPVDYGTTSTLQYSRWSNLIRDKQVTTEEKTIIIAVTKNEGRLDSVQSYDGQAFSVGAIQKTVNEEGRGEFPIQVRDFKKSFPDKFTTLFEECGWSLGGSTMSPKLYYQSPTDPAAKKVTGIELRHLIAKGFDSSSYKSKLVCIPLQSISKAIKDPDFQDLQITDAKKRLVKILNIDVSTGKASYKLSAFLKSKLGKATALDHHINRPNYVKYDFPKSLNRFFAKQDALIVEQNKTRAGDKQLKKLSRNPADWGADHAAYEKLILDDYGKTRRMSESNGVSVAPKRYAHLKKEL